MYFKVSLFLFSIVAAFTFSEITLRLISYPYETTRVFHPAHGDLDRVYELYEAINEDVEIVAIGDSFTNGGGGSWTQSYPYQLYQRLDERYTVINKGVCEDTTRGAYNRLKEYFDNRDKNKSIQSLVLVLIGVADTFYERGYHDAEKISQGLQGQEDDDYYLETVVKANRGESFLENLRTPRLFMFAYKEVKLRLRKLFEIFEKRPRHLQHGYSSDKVGECFNKDGANKELCLSSLFESMKKDLYLPNPYKTRSVYRFELASFFLVDQIVHFNNKKSLLPEQEIVKDLLHLMEELPRTLAFPNLVFNVVKYGLLQSQFQIGKDILPQINKSYSRDREFIDFIKDEYYPHELVIGDELNKQLGNISQTLEEVHSLRAVYLNNMVDLAEENNSKIIFLTYPLEYHWINELKKEIAEKRSIPVVDLENIFKEKIEKEDISKVDLINDWQHCTAEGYKLMANSLLLEIEQWLGIEL